MDFFLLKKKRKRKFNLSYIILWFNVFEIGDELFFVFFKDLL